MDYKDGLIESLKYANQKKDEAINLLLIELNRKDQGIRELMVKYGGGNENNIINKQVWGYNIS